MLLISEDSIFLPIGVEITIRYPIGSVSTPMKFHYDQSYTPQNHKSSKDPPFGYLDNDLGPMQLPKA